MTSRPLMEVMVVRPRELAEEKREKRASMAGCKMGISLFFPHPDFARVRFSRQMG